jgi:hypothetical protein
MQLLDDPIPEILRANPAPIVGAGQRTAAYRAIDVSYFLAAASRD